MSIQPNALVPTRLTLTASGPYLHLGQLNPSGDMVDDNVEPPLCGSRVLDQVMYLPPRSYFPTVRALDTEYGEVKWGSHHVPICPTCCKVFQAWASGRPITPATSGKPLSFEVAQK